VFSTLRRLTFLFIPLVSVSLGDNDSVESTTPGTADLGHHIKALLWQEPADITSLNLLYGAGGEKRQPHGKFTFLEEDMNGSNPKFDVRDEEGKKWKVKLGAEARPEVAATRLVWAAGYFTQEDYFLADLHVEGLPQHLHRGQKLVGPDGTFHNVRLKRSMEGEKKLQIWRWNSNPFVGTREFNGLRVLMALINNWDLKDSNNALYEDKHHDESVSLEVVYMVSDLGASFGTTAIKLSTEASKGNLEAYKRSKFITNRTADDVDFDAPGRPPLIETFNMPVFVHRVGMRAIGRHIPRADAKWLGQQLSRLSPEQIRDAFLAAGYSQDEANEFVTVVQGRIAELNAL
jgi:hypothetical protein